MAYEETHMTFKTRMKDLMQEMKEIADDLRAAASSGCYSEVQSFLMADVAEEIGTTADSIQENLDL